MPSYADSAAGDGLSESASASRGAGRVKGSVWPFAPRFPSWRIGSTRARSGNVPLCRRSPSTSRSSRHVGDLILIRIWAIPEKCATGIRARDPVRSHCLAQEDDVDRLRVILARRDVMSRSRLSAIESAPSMHSRLRESPCNPSSARSSGLQFRQLSRIDCRTARLWPGWSRGLHIRGRSHGPPRAFG